MQRLIDAANAVVDYFEGEYWCIDVLSEAIYDAEQQAADDALPITPEWIAANFRHMGEQYSAYQHQELPQLVWLLRFERLTLWDNPLPHIATRGQLRRLIAALKGCE